MERMKSRLERLESRTPPPPRARLGSVTLAELRALEKQIRRLETGAGEVGIAPEADAVKSVAPDDELAAVVREIERLERLDHAREGSTRWGE
jgi:hypothetical protein